MKRRIYLLSPATCNGERARMVMNPRAGFALAVQLRTERGAPLGDVFSMMSGLYFRGKLTYARHFAARPADIHVITPNRGLMPPDQHVTVADLQAFAELDIDERDRRYRAPLEEDARSLPGRSEIVLLGSIATRKYLDVLVPIFGARLLYPVAFVGKGDMSRGSLLLEAARAAVELEYAPAQLFKV